MPRHHISDSNPYATPIAFPSGLSPTTRPHNLAKRFAIHFAIAAAYALTYYFLSYLFPDVSDETRFIVAVIGLLFGSVIAAWYCRTNSALLTTMTGITWGFLWSLSAAVSVQNGSVSIWWPTFVPALFIVPVILFCLAWPVMHLSMRRASAA